jgi:hypothetical protein
MNGVLKKDETLTRAQFAARLKAKYPEYADLTDEELVTRTLQKFPYYSSYILAPGVPEGWVVVPSETTRALNRANSNSAIRFALMLWLLPPAALYAFGCSVRWVYRGFKTR